MPFFMVQHNITDSDFYAKNVMGMIAGTTGIGPGCGPLNEGLAAEPESKLSATEGGAQTLFQHSVNFVPGPDAKVGWCVFETKEGSKWTAELLKEKQDTEKAPWATQDVFEIQKPAGVDTHF